MEHDTNARIEAAIGNAVIGIARDLTQGREFDSDEAIIAAASIPAVNLSIMAETMAQQGEPLTQEALRHMIDLTTRVFTDQMDRARHTLLHGRPPGRGTEH